MGDRGQLAQVLNLIRSEAPMEEVYLCVEDQLETLRAGGRSGSRASSERDRAGPDDDDDDATRPRSSSRSRDRRAALSVQRLCDTPIISVPARPWTTVTDDDEFVSHLLSLWFTWQYPYFHWLDRDLFVEDMKSASLDANFCSPFLVNIMLAEACVCITALGGGANVHAGGLIGISSKPFSYYPEAYARPGDPSSIGEHFYAEAKRCLEAEEGRISLTSVQGACILYTWSVTVSNPQNAAKKRLILANPPLLLEQHELEREGQSRRDLHEPGHPHGSRAGSLCRRRSVVDGRQGAGRGGATDAAHARLDGLGRVRHHHVNDTCIDRPNAPGHFR